ncbi:MAG: hypothetical protein ACKOFU_06135, partial [Actinomycetota bacterium]
MNPSIASGESDLMIAGLAKDARRAQKTLAASSYKVRQSLIEAIADKIEEAKPLILEANGKDLAQGEASGMN